jgi:hypothetical protein
MSRTPFALVAAGLLTLGLSACSASTQTACNMPPVQQYAAPVMVAPANGATNVPDNIGSVSLSVTTAQFVGTMALKSPGGPTIALNLKPSGAGAAQYIAAIPTLAPATTYTLAWTLQYPGGCQAPAVVNTTSIGNFTTQ